MVVAKVKGKALIISVILRCAWAAAIYFVWRERNNMMHAKVPRTEDCILVGIRWSIQIKVSQMQRIVKDNVNLALADAWNIGLN